MFTFINYLNSIRNSQCVSITNPSRLIQNRVITAAYCGITPNT